MHIAYGEDPRGEEEATLSNPEEKSPT